MRSIIVQRKNACTDSRRSSMDPVKHWFIISILTEFACSGRFHVLFTFFSKSFSSFPHGTCALSVFLKYLALEGFYLPISTAIPSNTTLSNSPGFWLPHKERDFYPLWSCSHAELFVWKYKGKIGIRPQLPRSRIGDLRLELFLLHSPLLKESLLVSCPPLSYMFKFSGSSCLS